MPTFQQRDATDCGVCCLGFVAAHHRKKIPLAVLRTLAGTGPHGSTALGLVEAARKSGFTAKGVKGAVDALPTVPLPAIAHCLIDQCRLHYVVLVAWSPRGARVMDPATGRVEKWRPEKFRTVWTGVLVLLAPGDAFAPGDATVSPWRRLWSLLQPHRPVLVQAACGAVVATVLGLGTSVYVQQIVDRVIPDGNRHLLNLLAAVMLAVVALRLLLGIFQSLLSLRTAQRIDAALMLAYYHHLLRLPQPFFDTMRVGEITSRLGDAVKVRNFLNNSLLGLLLHPLILVFSLGAMFLYSAQLAGLSLALIPLNALVYWVANRLNRHFQRRLMEQAADFDAQVVESLHAQPVVRRFGLEEYSGLRTETRLVRLLQTGWRAALGGLACGTAGSLVTQAYGVGLLWCGTGLVLDAGLTPGALMSCYTLSSYLTGPVTALLGLNASIQEALIATDRLFEIMDLALEPDQGRLELTADRPPDFRLEAVSFHHPGRSATLHEVSLEIPAGRITALVGESGCGKSTLLALLQRLYLPDSGRILLGGADLRYYGLAGLRRSIGSMPQQTVLLSGTVLENLAPGEAEPDMARLLQVCRDTGALEFIERLPQGFFTHLAENGANLSGGQRQRLALARLLYRDPPVLLLDEPSSALDAKAEESLLPLLSRLRAAGKTIILATHQSRLLVVADQIVTLAGGRVISISPSPSPAAGVEGSVSPEPAAGAAGSGSL